MRSIIAVMIVLSLGVATNAHAQGSSASKAHGPKDKEARALYEKAINDDYLNVDLDSAETKLKKGLSLCAKKQCSGQVVGKLHMGLAIVEGLGRQDMGAAVLDMGRALKADPNATTDEGFTSPKFEAAFKKAKKAAKNKPTEEAPETEQAPAAEAPKNAAIEPAEPPRPDTSPPQPKSKPDSGPPLTKTFSLETSGYIDNDATEVLSPSISFGVENPVTGWGVSGSVLVDAVTAASADIVATASPKWRDVRYVPALGGHFKVDDTTFSLGGSASVESDYIAGNGTLGVATDFRKKTITPGFSYSFGYNVAGRKGTPYSVYQRDLHSHTLQANVTFILDKATIFVPAITADLEFGDPAKPYRYVPTFKPGTVLTPGESLADVNKLRTNIALEERLPQTRQRYAFAALIAHRFHDVTLRFDERFYIDSWGLKATTTDFMLPIDATSSFRIWPHLRFHAQTGVEFWQLAYEAKQVGGAVIASGLRAGDRELGPLLGSTFGAGFRVGGESIGWTVTADGIYTRFLDQLYIVNRIAGFGSTTLEVIF